MALNGVVFDDSSIKLEHHYSDLAYDKTSDVHEKVGEIYRLTSKHFTFVCLHCEEQFCHFELFTEHIQTHFMDILSISVPGNPIFSDIDDVKPDINAIPLEVANNDDDVDTQTGSNIGEDNQTAGAVAVANYKTVHVRGIPIANPSEPQTCDICSKTVSNMANLRIHMRRHEELPFPCTQCDRRCATPSELRSHIASHSEQRDFHCDRCPKAFKLKKALVAHQQRCTGEKSTAAEGISSGFSDSSRDLGSFRRSVDRTERRKTNAEMSSEATHIEKMEESVVVGGSRSSEKTCEICSKTVSNMTSLRIHMRRHVELPFACPHCDRRCAATSELRAHLAAHSDRRDFVCDECPKSFKLKKALVAHKRGVHKQPKECDAQIEERAELDEKLTKQAMYDSTPQTFPDEFNVLEDKPYDGDSGNGSTNTTNSSTFKCIFCDYSGYTKEKFRKHSKACTDKAFFCWVCSRMFVDKKSRLEHLQTHTKDYQCDTCGEQYRTIFKLKIHMQSHADGLPFKCDECPNAYKSLNSLQYHKKLHQGILPYSCDICNKGMHSRSKLKTHRWKYHGIAADDFQPPEPHTCDICDKTMQSAEHLKAHMRRHGPPKWKCPQCDLGCMTPSELRTHLVSHSDQRDYQCDKCPKKFKLNKTLLIHRRLHDRIVGQFHCHVCDKPMANANYLQLHMRIHTNEGLVECTQCNKKFLTQSFLNAHMRVHSDQRNFKCDMCPKTFKAKHTFVAHRRIHLGEFSYTCQWCGKGFHDNRLYKRHTLATHGRLWNDSNSAEKSE